MQRVDTQYAKMQSEKKAENVMKDGSSILETANSKKRERNFEKENSIVANVVNNLTCSMRFEGDLNVDLNEITMNMVPFPKMHFL